MSLESLETVDEKHKLSLKKLGARIAARRRELDITQRELSELVGLHRSFLAQVESGERTTTIKYLFAIAAALRIEASVLLESLS